MNGSPRFLNSTQKSKILVPYAVGFGLLMTVLAIASAYMVVDIDLFHEMALFREFIGGGQMPLTDDFAYTPTLDRVVHHEWGTGAVLYSVMVASNLGAAGLVALKHLLCFGVCIGCYIFARRSGATQANIAWLSFIALNIGAWMSFTTIRAQLFTLAFLVGLFYLIDLDRRGHKWWIALWIPLSIVWGNMHAGVVSGIGILAMYGLARLIDAAVETRSLRETFHAIKHLLLAGVLTAAAINVNPYGLDYVPYLIRAIRMDRPLIQEWMPIWKIASFNSQLLFLFSVAVATYAIAKSKRTATFETLALMMAGYLAMKNVRHGSLYAVTWICLVPPLFELTAMGRWFREKWDRHAASVAVISLACGIVALGSAMQSKFWELKIPTARTAETRGLPVFPVGAVDYLREQKFNGNLFTPFQTGAYVSWNLYPAVKISVDSRYEVAFPDGAVEENWKFYRADEGWLKTLAKYKTDAVLVPVHDPLFEAMENQIAEQPDFGWRRVFVDAGAAVYVRESLQSKFQPVSFQR